MKKSPTSFRSVGDSVATLTRPIFAERGFVNAELLAAWPRVVGADLAAVCAPTRVKFPRKGGPGVLHLRLTNPAKAPLIQHDEPAIVERINTFFGYRAIERLHCQHASPPADTPPRRDAGETAATESVDAADDLTARVEDPGLRAALRALGAATRPKRPDPNTR